MTPQEIRAALSRPPVFGDVQQIAALKALRVEEEGHDGKTEFSATVSWSGEETVTVWADDASEAQEMALEQVDMDDCEVEYHVRKV